MNLCPCNSGKTYEACCEVYHKRSKQPESAEVLMRARYSAFVKNEIKFIGETHVPGTTDFDEAEATHWAKTSTWKGLEIVKTKQGTSDFDKGIVEFKAIYADENGKDYLHHEISNFKKIEDIWYYNDGQIVGTGPIKRAEPKIGRNDPCSCGSGKKYKKCCGA